MRVNVGYSHTTPTLILLHFVSALSQLNSLYVYILLELQYVNYMGNGTL